jgi:hypothetical protein
MVFDMLHCLERATNFIMMMKLWPIRKESCTMIIVFVINVINSERAVHAIDFALSKCADSKQYFDKHSKEEIKSIVMKWLCLL